MFSNTVMYSILDMCADAVVIINDIGIVSFFNKSAEVLWGYSREEVLEKNIKHFLPLEHKLKHDEYLQHFITTGEKKVIGKGREVELMRKDGELVPVLLTLSYAIVDGKYIFTAFIKDYREIKKNQKELSMLSLIASKTDNSVVVTNPDGEIQWINEGFSKRTGYVLEEVIGKTPGSFLQGPDTDKEVVKSITEKLKSNESFTIELLNYSKTGQKHWISSTINPVFDNNGKIFYFIAVQNDITDLKRKNEELYLAKEEAELARKSQEIFLANMSHEIRTPMNAILGFVDILNKTSLDDIQKDHLDIIRKSSKNLLNIINDILDFSKIEAGEMTFEKNPFCLKESLNSLIQTTSYKANEKGLNINYQYSENYHDLCLMGDSLRLNQILLNLVTNAIKFTDNGNIDIKIKILTETDKDIKLQFNIIDTGIGIAKEKMNLLFQSFKQTDYSTSRNYGGTGLGLAISKKLVELQNGTIGVDSTFGKGSTFYFELTFEKSSQNKSLIVDNETETKAFDFKEISVLMAEDNVFNQHVVTYYLNEWGCKYEVANNGIEVLQKLEKSKFDIILMDIHMPIMDGIEATQIIRNSSDSKINKIHIIALTASVVKGAIKKYIDVGMNDFVSKPFNSSELANALLRGLKIKTDKNVETKTDKEIPDLSKLKEISKSNIALLKSLTDSFTKQVTEADFAFKESINNHDFKTIKGFAHKIKPSFHTLGLFKMFLELSNLEKIAGEETDFEAVEQIITKFQKELPSIIEFLNNENNLV